MKKAIVGILAALALVFSSLAITAPAEAASRVTCWTRATNNYQNVNMHNKVMSIVITVRFKDCNVRGGTDFVRPFGIRIQTNVSGRHMDCGSDPWTNPVVARKGYFETRWKVYFGSSFGDNFSLKKFSTACSTNTIYDTGYKPIGKRTSVPLRVGKNGGFATFRANATADWRSTSDKSWSQFGKMYSY